MRSPPPRLVPLLLARTPAAHFRLYFLRCCFSRLLRDWFDCRLIREDFDQLSVPARLCQRIWRPRSRRIDANVSAFGAGDGWLIGSELPIASVALATRACGLTMNAMTPGCRHWFDRRGCAFWFALLSLSRAPPATATNGRSVSVLLGEGS